MQGMASLSDIAPDSPSTANPSPAGSADSSTPKWEIDTAATEKLRKQDEFLKEEARQDQRNHAIISWVWTAGVAFGPTLLAYVVLFPVSRWIYRGFRSGPQI